MPGEFIALDWGTTSFRAYRADRAGAVLETVAAQEGILAVPAGDFEKALERRIGGWNRGLPVMAAGMITSRQGWVERPYVPCPAAASDLAAAIHAHDTATGRRIHFVTGLSCRNRAGVPEVMRSEEVQVFGSLDLGVRCFVTPGTHSKWIATDGTRILSFATYVTGEVYAALKDHTILGRLMAPGPADE
jgi:2-dehydro-3-deoxygalactonokinase